MNLTKKAVIKYEIKTLHLPSINIEDRNRHALLLVVDDSEQVVLIRDYNKFMNAISETINVVCTEGPIASGSDSIVNILSPEGNSLKLCLLAHIGRLYFSEQTISKSSDAKTRHRRIRNPNTYLNIRQKLKEQHKIQIKPFNRTVTLLDLKKLKGT